MNTGILIILIVCRSNYMGVAQQTNGINSSPEVELIEWVSDAYGSDDMLVSGTVYLPRSPLIDGHPYFDSDTWFNATLYIDGRTFIHQEIKYNLAIQQLILNAVFREGATAKIVLSTAKIDSLYLDHHLFINGNHLFTGTNDTTFYEIIYRNGFSFVSRYHKEYVKKYSNSTPFGLWSHQTASHFIFTGTWQPLSGKRSFFTYFTNGKDDIKRFMKRNHIKFNKASSDQLKQILAFCSQYYQK